MSNKNIRFFISLSEGVDILCDNIEFDSGTNKVFLTVNNSYIAMFSNEHYKLVFEFGINNTHYYSLVKKEVKWDYEDEIRTRKALKELDIDTKGKTGESKTFSEILEEINNKWGNGTVIKDWEKEVYNGKFN